jgi:predicted ATPase
VSEAARDVIDQELASGRTLEQIRGDESAFQARVFEEKWAREMTLPEDAVLLFDRGLHDTLAFLSLHDAEPDSGIVARCERAAYARVFLFQALPGFPADYARRETRRQAARLEPLLAAAYRRFPLTVVPPGSIDHRVHLVSRWLPGSPK